MNSIDEIIARLQKGESIDAIALDMTNALNAANEQYEAMRKASEAAEQKRLDAQDVANAFNYYVRTYYNNFGYEQDRDMISADDLPILCDGVKELQETLHILTDNAEKVNVEKYRKSINSDVDIIKDFLRTL